MPQIAQQDYIYINIPEEETPNEVITQEQATEMYKRGVFLDVILVLPSGTQSRIVSVDFDPFAGKVSAFCYVEQGAITFIEY